MSGSTAQASANAMSPAGTISGPRAILNASGTARWEMGVAKLVTYRLSWAILSDTIMPFLISIVWRLMMSSLTR